MCIGSLSFHKLKLRQLILFFRSERENLLTSSGENENVSWVTWMASLFWDEWINATIGIGIMQGELDDFNDDDYEDSEVTDILASISHVCATSIV